MTSLICNAQTVFSGNVHISMFILKVNATLVVRGLASSTRNVDVLLNHVSIRFLVITCPFCHSILQCGRLGDHPVLYCGRRGDHPTTVLRTSGNQPVKLPNWRIKRAAMGEVELTTTLFYIHDKWWHFLDFIVISFQRSSVNIVKVMRRRAGVSSTWWREGATGGRLSAKIHAAENVKVWRNRGNVTRCRWSLAVIVPTLRLQYYKQMYDGIIVLHVIPGWLVVVWTQSVTYQG